MGVGPRLPSFENVGEAFVRPLARLDQIGHVSGLQRFTEPSRAAGMTEVVHLAFERVPSGCIVHGKLHSAVNGLRILEGFFIAVVSH